MLAFLDTETTGLDPNEDALLEVALIITEDNLDTICSVNTVVSPVGGLERFLEKMNPFVIEMHTKNGLLDDVRNSSIRRYEGELALIKFMEDLCRRRDLKLEHLKLPLCGNTIGFDRNFLARHMPKFHSLFHYRSIDVTSFNEVAKRAWPHLHSKRPGVEGGVAHRAHADAKSSIAQLKHYVERLGLGLPELAHITGCKSEDKYTLVVIESPYAPTVKKPEGDRCYGGDCGALPHHVYCDYCNDSVDFNHQLNRNIQYARAAMKDSLSRGEAPYASHLLYTQDGVLDDTDPKEREWGITAGFAWRQVAKKTVVYNDLGISRGMQYGIDDAQKRGTPVEYRTLGPNWMELLK